MRIALIGAHGQLGTALSQTLRGEVIPLSHQDIEITDAAAVSELIEQTAFDLVINTAAYNQVDRAEDDLQSAYAVNAWGARNLAVACARVAVPLVHFSTDYVFGLDAGRVRPYTEEHSPGPLSVYANSKLAGEYFVRSLCIAHYVIRTCGLYGRATSPGKGNFIETMLRLGKERGAVSVVNDQRCTPTSAFDLAEAVADLVETECYGLYHATNMGSCTWYELAGEIFSQARIAVRVKPISSMEFNAKARRPDYSVLDTKFLSHVIGRNLPDWHEALDGYLRSRSK